MRSTTYWPGGTGMRNSIWSSHGTERLFMLFRQVFPNQHQKCKISMLPLARISTQWILLYMHRARKGMKAIVYPHQSTISEQLAQVFHMLFNATTSHAHSCS